MSGRKRLAYWTGKVGAVSAELCELVRRNRKKISRVTIATGFTMVPDSSGTCGGEPGYGCGNALGDFG
jgi:hypothetical protein